jgi:hypothetical protein
MSGQDSRHAQGIAAIGCFRSINTVCNVSIVRWNTGLNQLEKYQLVQCLVNETKKKRVA